MAGASWCASDGVSCDGGSKHQVQIQGTEAAGKRRGKSRKVLNTEECGLNLMHQELLNDVKQGSGG